MTPWNTGLHCRAGRDGDCNWQHCPQLLQWRNHCPLDILAHSYTDEDGHWLSDIHEEAFEALWDGIAKRRKK